MKSLFIVLLLISVGCTSAHKNDHRHPNAIGEGFVDGNGHINAIHEDDHHYHEAEMEGPNPHALPQDFIFNDLNENGVVDEAEAREDNLAVDLGVPNTFFSNNPIIAMGLQKREFILTIDDGPTRGVTKGVLKVLRKYKVKATFFLSGERIRGKEDIVQAIIDDGHTIGNHTYSHVLKNITSRTIDDEILKAHGELVRALGGVEPPGKKFFRAPGLSWNKAKAANLNANNQTNQFIGPIHANLGTDAPVADWHCWSKSGNRKSPGACANLYYKQLINKGRGVILAHDLSSKTPDFLRILLDKLDRSGGIGKTWHFKTLEESKALDKWVKDSANQASSVGNLVDATPKEVSPFSGNPRVTVRSEAVEDIVETAGEDLTDTTKIFYSGGNYLRAGHILKYESLGKSKTVDGYKLLKIKITKMESGFERYNQRKVYVWEEAF